MIRMRKGIVIDYVLTMIVIISFIAFVVSCAALLLLAAFIKSDSARIGLANLSMLVVFISVIILVVCVTLLTTRLGKRDNIANGTESSEDEFEQKYMSLLTDDTKARREFIELYRKKEVVN